MGTVRLRRIGQQRDSVRARVTASLASRRSLELCRWRGYKRNGVRRDKWGVRSRIQGYS